jgi:dTMP kinase
MRVSKHHKHPKKNYGPLFITFEGGEGAGKTTLIEKIVFQLSLNHPILHTREPGGTELGEKVRSLLLQSTGPMSPHAELALFLASRAQHLNEIIRPALLAGKIVLCDRFNDSSIAYQGAARGLGIEKVASICNFFCQDLQPDLTLYLDIDPAIGLKRAHDARHSQDRIEAEAITFHTKIREGYHAIAKMDPKRFHILDAMKPREVVFEEAMKRIDALIK